MQIIYGLSSVPSKYEKGIVALGFFDGLHKGHQEILRRALLLEEGTSLPVTVFTFDRHPLEIVKRKAKESPMGSASPKLLTPLNEKVQLMEEHGIDFLLVGEFTTEFSQIPPESFIDEILCERLSAKVIVAGFNYRFGYQHKGDMELLMNSVSRCGFKVVVVPPVYNGDRPVSSTLIRELISKGKLSEVEPLLRRWYSIHGKVVKGEGRGITLGFPTANLEVNPQKLLPKNGIYAVVVRHEDHFYPAVMNIGTCPTFDNSLGDNVPDNNIVFAATVEVHLLDVSFNLYGANIEVHIIARLRNEKKFSNSDLLKKQIEKDVIKARKLLLGKRETVL